MHGEELGEVLDYSLNHQFIVGELDGSTASTPTHTLVVDFSSLEERLSMSVEEIIGEDVLLTYPVLLNLSDDLYSASEEGSPDNIATNKENCFVAEVAPTDNPNIYSVTVENVLSLLSNNVNLLPVRDVYGEVTMRSINAIKYGCGIYNWSFPTAWCVLSEGQSSDSYFIQQSPTDTVGRAVYGGLGHWYGASEFSPIEVNSETSINVSFVMDSVNFGTHIQLSRFADTAYGDDDFAGYPEKGTQVFEVVPKTYPHATEFTFNIYNKWDIASAKVPYLTKTLVVPDYTQSTEDLENSNVIATFSITKSSSVNADITMSLAHVRTNYGRWGLVDARSFVSYSTSHVNLPNATSFSYMVSGYVKTGLKNPSGSEIYVYETNSVPNAKFFDRLYCRNTPDSRDIYYDSPDDLRDILNQYVTIPALSGTGWDALNTILTNFNLRYSTLTNSLFYPHRLKSEIIKTELHHSNSLGSCGFVISGPFSPNYQRFSNSRITPLKYNKSKFISSSLLYIADIDPDGVEETAYFYATPQTYSVRVGETRTETISLPDGWQAALVDSPANATYPNLVSQYMTDGLGFSSYSVYTKDENYVTPNMWDDYGGKIELSLGSNPSEIIMKLTGPSEILFPGNSDLDDGNYEIGIVPGGSIGIVISGAGLKSTGTVLKELKTNYSYSSAVNPTADTIENDLLTNDLCRGVIYNKILNRAFLGTSTVSTSLTYSGGYQDNSPYSYLQDSSLLVVEPPMSFNYGGKGVFVTSYTMHPGGLVDISNATVGFPVGEVDNTYSDLTVSQVDNLKSGLTVKKDDIFPLGKDLI